MADISKNFTDELRAKLSIVDIISRKIPLTKKGKDFWGCCPFHNEKTPSFKVNEEMGKYYCFGCGEKGDIISFVMKTNNMMYPDAIRELANIAGLKMPEFKPRDPEVAKREQTYFDIMEEATKIYQKKLYEPDGEIALSYLRGRGFDDEKIKKYRLGYSPKNSIISAKFSNQKQSNVIATGLVRESRDGPGVYDFFRGRLMFPIMSPAGSVIAFSARSLDGSEPKYINTGDTEFFHKRMSVFGLNYARDAIYKNNRSIIVEGQIDAIQMQTHGFGETVAPLGTALTEEHLQILCKMNRNITFCFDGDNAGNKAAARALGIVMPLLRPDSDVRFAFVRGGKDPDDILKQANGTASMKKIIDTDSLSLVDFLWDVANKNFVVATPGGRVMAEKFITEQLEKIKDNNLKFEMKSEFDNRKWNGWHKWKKSGIRNQESEIKLPDIDNTSKKTLSNIANKYPDLIEKHSEFFVISQIKIDDNTGEMDNITHEMAEKFIMSMKLNFYLKTLQSEKKDLTNIMLSGDERASVRLKIVDAEIEKTLANIKKLSDL